MWKIWEKRPFFRADMAGLGKYHTGGYGRIRVYRVKDVEIAKKVRIVGLNDENIKQLIYLFLNENLSNRPTKTLIFLKFLR